MGRIRIDVIAIAIDIATKRAFVAVAIAPGEGQIPMVGSYLSERGMSATFLLTGSSIEEGSVTHESIDYGPAAR